MIKRILDGLRLLGDEPLVHVKFVDPENEFRIEGENGSMDQVVAIEAPSYSGLDDDEGSWYREGGNGEFGIVLEETFDTPETTWLSFTVHSTYWACYDATDREYVNDAGMQRRWSSVIMRQLAACHDWEEI